jgi:hypothetical protein
MRRLSDSLLKLARVGWVRREPNGRGIPHPARA